MVFRQQRPVVMRVVASWVVILFLAFFMPTPAVFYAGAAVAVFALAPKSHDDQLQFVAALLPMIPMNAIWRVSLPGIETLMWMDHVRLLSICILLPLSIQIKKKRYLPVDSAEADASQRIYKLLLVFLMATLFLSLRGVQITSMLRAVIESYFGYLLLIFVYRAGVRSRETVDKVLLGILIGGVILAVISFIEQITLWKLFNEINPSLFYWDHFKRHIRDFRWGMMRTPVSMTPIPFGFLMAISLVICIYFAGRKKFRSPEYHGSHLITLVVLVGLLFSGSRGAWMTAVVMILSMFYFDRRFKVFRPLVVIGGIVSVFLIPAIMSYLAESDPYGTFEYRINLLTNALVVIRENFFLGDMQFANHPALEASRQSEGIIDIVNSYLRFALQFGVPALVLLIYVIYKTIVSLAGVRGLAERYDGQEGFEWQARSVLAIFIGGVFMISTVSLVDRVPHYLWLSCVLCLSMLSLVPEVLRQRRRI